MIQENETAQYHAPNQRNKVSWVTASTGTGSALGTFWITAAALGIFSVGPAQGQTLTEQQAASGTFAVHDQGTQITPLARKHLEAAEKAAGEDFLGGLLLCNQARPVGQELDLPTAEVLRLGGGDSDHPTGPTRVFDNLYYVGVPTVTAWAVTTPQGIILIDALSNRTEAKGAIEAGLRKYGLDPAQIKYIVVTHGHGDHYGGAAYLQQKYHARVLMSALDWALAPTTLDKPTFEPAPPRDLVIRDGQKLSLGGEILSLYITPGHTLGTVSVLIPVTDHGEPHVAALWGGTGLNFPHSRARFKLYSDSARRFTRLATRAGADVPLSNHPENDLVVEKIARLARRGPHDPNPFVMGKDAVRRYLTTFSECALSYGAQVGN